MQSLEIYLIIYIDWIKCSKRKKVQNILLKLSEEKLRKQ